MVIASRHTEAAVNHELQDSVELIVLSFGRSNLSVKATRSLALYGVKTANYILWALRLLCIVLATLQS